MSVTAKSTAKKIEIVDTVEPDKLKELLEREGRIERAQRNAWYETGLELRAIKDGDLYKTPREEPVAGRYSFTTFEEYVEGRWEWGIRHAERLILAATAVENMRPIGRVLPTTESHVRELLKLESDEDRATVWQRVVDEHQKPTAKDIEAEVKKFIAEVKKEHVTLTEWESLDETMREKWLGLKSARTLNKQDTTSIEWAQWSWNPVTGCKHDCPYCYARDMANRYYPQGFEPSFWPGRLSYPGNTTVPDQAKTDVAYKNVFTCSMADLFGRWVPDEWIESVLNVAEDSPQWNFLCLTKFPQRVSEFGTLPKNVWMGTTVDCQDRVANAEKAFAKMGGGIKWLSVEPMLTPLKFKRLDVFDWVVVGGASRSNQTPEWSPPFPWVYELHKQCDAAGIPVYHKSNLFSHVTDDIRLRSFPWQKTKNVALPEQLKYLNIK